MWRSDYSHLLLFLLITPKISGSNVPKISSSSLLEHVKRQFCHINRLYPKKMGPSEPETVEMSADIEAEGTLDDGSFACGVVEGMPLLYWVIFVIPHKHPTVFF